MLLRRQLYHTAMIYRRSSTTGDYRMALDIYQSTWSNLYNTQPTATKNPKFICRFHTQTISQLWHWLHNTILPPPRKDATYYAKGEITLHLQGHTVNSILHSKTLTTCWPCQNVECWYHKQWPIYFVSGYVINWVHATNHCKQVLVPLNTLHILYSYFVKLSTTWWRPM
jgi:hypothetical protein